MTAAATRLQPKPVITDAVRARVAATTTTKTDDAIRANTFYKIMFAPDASPEAKRAAVAAALAFAGTRAECRQRVAEFEAFKEYLAQQREAMAKEIIKFTDTEAFSELQAVYGTLNDDLQKFDDAMAPLTGILDALYTLRTEGATVDAFNEIKNDRNRDKAQAEARRSREDQVSSLTSQLEMEMRKVAGLGQKKTLFGYGPLSEETRQEIARRQVSIDGIKTSLDKVRAEAVAALPVEADQSKFAAEKKQLRDLLDLTSDEHKDRQKNLVATALTFVENAGERTGSVRSHLGKMSSQIQNLYDANGQMNTVYAVMAEGIKEAAAMTLKKRDELMIDPAAAGDTLKKLQRDQAKSDIEDHVALLDASAQDTATTSADLTSQSARIKTMKAANDDQIVKARSLQTQGVAGVADRLSVVLQAVSAAALGESSAMARDTLQRMRDSTNAVAQKEIIRVATNIDDANSDVLKAIGDLDSYGEVMRTATGIERKGLTEMQANLQRLRDLSKATAEDIRAAGAVHADVGSGADAPETKEPEPTSPFGMTR